MAAIAHYGSFPYGLVHHNIEIRSRPPRFISNPFQIRFLDSYPYGNQIWFLYSFRYDDQPSIIIESPYPPDEFDKNIDFMAIWPWPRPPPGFVALNCDGSVRRGEESSTAGYGFIVRNHIGEVIVAKAKCEKLIGQEASHGHAVLKTEMTAILNGLRALASQRKSYPLVEVQSDSNDAVKIVNKNAGCPEECKDILKEIKAVSECFEECHCRFVYRESNRAADFMSKFLRSEGEEYMDLTELPFELDRIVTQDAVPNFFVARYRKSRS